MYRDRWDYALQAFIFAVFGIVIALFVMIGFWLFTEPSGEITGKYFDDSDVICSKGCVVTEDCWGLNIKGQHWWSEPVCVSEQSWNDAQVGGTYNVKD